MSSYRPNASFNSLSISSKSLVSPPSTIITTPTTTTAIINTPTTSPNYRLLDVDSHRLSIGNVTNINASGVSNHQRRTSIVNHHQRRSSQLRKASFTTSTLVCAQYIIILIVGH